MAEEIESFASPNNPKVSGKEWHGKGFPLYDPEIHFPMLREVFGNGGGLDAFIGACGISSATFYEWLKKYPEFKLQYEVSRSKGCAIWEVLPLEWAKNGVAVNHSYWAMIYRERYKKSVAYLKEEVDDSASSRMKAAWQSLREGGINPQEFNQVASGIATECRIVEADTQQKALEYSKESSAANKALSDDKIKAIMDILNSEKVTQNIQSENTP